MQSVFQTFSHLLVGCFFSFNFEMRARVTGCSAPHFHSLTCVIRRGFQDHTAPCIHASSAFKFARRTTMNHYSTLGLCRRPAAVGPDNEGRRAEADPTAAVGVAPSA
jgi:hypothetical protein